MIGKYELVRCVGRGGMGSVWEARHATLGNPVAIKLVEIDMSDPDARRRFDNEARAAAALRSSHVIRVFDHGITDEGKPYMVMELLAGEGLDARLARVGRMTVSETSAILAQVCRALDNAHAEGIVHRDLKPENVFLSRDEEGVETVKVLDFGVAKIQKAGELDASTRSGTIVGTPFYMAPEQGRGLRGVDHRADLWSLGVIAYECVVGRLPFDGATLGALLVEICSAPIPVPSNVNPSVPKAFDTWFARACARDPKERFSSAAELADALARIMQTEVAATQPMLAPKRASKRFAAGLFATFAVTLGALAAVHAFEDRKPVVLASAAIVSAAVQNDAPPVMTEPIATLSPPPPEATVSAPAPVSAKPLKQAVSARVSGPGF
jgi:serine/threonine-protein kinase